MRSKRLLIMTLLVLQGSSLACMAAYQVLWGTPEPASPPVNPPVMASSTPETSNFPEVPTQSEEACTNSDCAEACMSNLSAYLSDAGKPLAPTHGSLSARNDDESEVVLVTYDILGDKIGNGVFEDVSQSLRSFRDDTTAHEKLWDYYATIIPSEERTMLANFVIFTDGVDNTLAWVDTSTDDTSKWDLGIDIRDTRDPRELTYTLIHEYAHLITLSDDQMPYSSRGCDTYASDGFCAEPDSYINLFVERFWSSLLSEWDEINTIMDDNEYYQRLDDFYYAHEDEFINDYAATNPEEDLAETWSFFILSPKPAGNSIAEQKILFLYEFPELVNLRTQIVNRVCAYAAGQ